MRACEVFAQRTVSAIARPAPGSWPQRTWSTWTLERRARTTQVTAPPTATQHTRRWGLLHFRHGLGLCMYCRLSAGLVLRRGWLQRNTQWAVLEVAMCDLQACCKGVLERVTRDGLLQSCSLRRGRRAAATARAAARAVARRESASAAGSTAATVMELAACGTERGQKRWRGRPRQQRRRRRRRGAAAAG